MGLSFAKAIGTKSKRKKKIKTKDEILHDRVLELTKRVKADEDLLERTQRHIVKARDAAIRRASR